MTFKLYQTLSVCELSLPFPSNQKNSHGIHGSHQEREGGKGYVKKGRHIKTCVSETARGSGPLVQKSCTTDQWPRSIVGLAGAPVEDIGGGGDGREPQTDREAQNAQNRHLRSM